MADIIGYVLFPEFFTIWNNSNYSSISGMFSVLGAPRKVIYTVLEYSTHMGPIIGYAISQIFQRGYNNYKDCSISGVLSALGAPRKVVDTIFEST